MTDLVPTAEAATMLRVSPRSIARWVQTGRLTPKAKGPGTTGVLLFDRGDVAKVAAELADEAEAEAEALRAVARTA